MPEHIEFVENKRLERVKKALESHAITAHIVDNSFDVVPLVRQLVPTGASVANGGSVSLAQCGVMDLLRSAASNGDYVYIDRDEPGADRAERLRAALGADYYFASVNALTEQGEIYEMDGAGNRVAALAFGPKHVILVVGRNKIVDDLPAARRRNARIAAPTNAKRLSCATPCASTGQCANCDSPARICNIELVISRQRDPERMTVILVNEDLGY